MIPSMVAFALVSQMPADASPATPPPAPAPMPASQPPPAKKTVLAVLDVTVNEAELDPMVGQSLSTVIASEIELRAGERYSVIAPSQVRSILRQEVQKQLAGEMTSGVSEQLAKALSSDLIATSSVTSVGGEWVFSLELVDTATAQVLSRQSVSYLGEPAGLVELVRPYVARLIDGTKAEEYRGNLEVLVNEEEARVVLDERELGLSSVTRVGELPIGRHHVLHERHVAVLAH